MGLRGLPLLLFYNTSPPARIDFSRPPPPVMSSLFSLLRSASRSNVDSASPASSGLSDPPASPEREGGSDVPGVSASAPAPTEGDDFVHTGAVVRPRRVLPATPERSSTQSATQPSVYALRSRSSRLVMLDSDGEDDTAASRSDAEPPVRPAVSGPPRSGRGGRASHKRVRSTQVDSAGSPSKKSKTADIEMTPSGRARRSVKMEFGGWNPDPDVVSMSPELQNVFSLHVSQAPQPDLVLPCCMLCVRQW
jgi:hypothetical protein